jgi:hypothetical protein
MRPHISLSLGRHTVGQTSEEVATAVKESTDGVHRSIGAGNKYPEAGYYLSTAVPYLAA